jgi:hypothetical protein
MGKNLTFKNLFWASIIINLVEIILIATLRKFLPPVLPLFYGRPAGVTQLTNVFGFLIAPASALLLTIVNLIVSSQIKDEFLKKILAVSTLMGTFLVLITIIKIIFLVGLF